MSVGLIVCCECVPVPVSVRAIVCCECVGLVYVITSQPTTYYNSTHSSIILVCVLMGQGATELNWKHKGIMLSDQARRAVNTSKNVYGPIEVVRSFLRLCPASGLLGLGEGEYSCEGSVVNATMLPAPPTMSVCPTPGKGL